MPESRIPLRVHDDLLTFEEIVRLVKILTVFGVRKVRITGGEPLMRRGVTDLIATLVRIPLIEEVCLTTNGILFPLFARDLKESGLRRINISLDTLQRDKFLRITGKDLFDQVIRGINNAQEYGYSPIKINMVVMKGINDDEILDFVNFSMSHGLILRFIEFMRITPLWNEDYYLPIKDVIDMCESEFKMERVGNKDAGPAVNYRIGDDGLLGFIKTDENRCRECKRLRILSTGELKVCLYESEEVSLRDILRNGASDETVRDLIGKRLDIKARSTYRDFDNRKFYMFSIGG
jgi:cyclic pyranopterin phosphate synthase